MMVKNRSVIRRILLVDFPVALILLFTLAPYLWMALTSLTQESKLFTDGPSLIGATLELSLIHI